MISLPISGHLRAPLLLCMLTLLIFSCDSDTATGAGGDITTPTAPRLEIRLTDAPGDYEKVLIEVVDVQVKFGEDDFLDLDTDYAGTYDLLELTNGLDTLLATSEVEAAELREVRIILGDDNFVQVDGELLPLRTPSAQQSGLKVRFNDPITLEAGRAYVLLLDFDAGRSIVCAGNSGNLNLRPVLRASIQEVDGEVLTGGIRGSVSPNQNQYVTAINPGVDTLGTFVDAAGAFTFLNVPPASTYTITVAAPEGATYENYTISDVAVTAGEVTELGVIVLE